MDLGSDRMTQDLIASKYSDIQARLKIDCAKCSGLCCVALYCVKTDGFPADKEAGVPCGHLLPDFRCDIHSELVSKKLRGCLAYDCFGAGQKVTQNSSFDGDWRSPDGKAEEIFGAFRIVFQLHQIEWYLLEALSLTSDNRIESAIEALISENEEMTSRTANEILRLDIEVYRSKANELLKQVSRTASAQPMCSSDGKANVGKDYIGKDFQRANLNGSDFSMALLIAANLEGCSLHCTNFLGADMRDVNVKNTNLSDSLFLSQMQINSAKGNANTKLPVNLSRPASW